jgi:hypothetical protein
MQIVRDEEGRILGVFPADATQEEMQQALAGSEDPGRGGLTDLVRGQASRKDLGPNPITMRDLARSYAQGGLLGWADEAQAKLFSGLQGYGDDSLPAAWSLYPPVHWARMQGAIEGDEGYEAYRDQERADLERFRAEHPVASTAAQVAGGYALGGGLTQAAPGSVQAVQSLPYLQRAGVAAGAGATGGAIAGAGEAESMDDLADKAWRGAKFGAVAGPLMETVATGAQAVKRSLSPQRAAERTMRKAIRRGDMSVKEVKAKLKSMDPGAVLADVNDGLRDELDRIVNTPGTARTRAIKQLTKRSEGQLDEILNATGPGNYYEHLETIQKLKKDMASPLYETAFEKGVPHTRRLERLFKVIEDNVPGAWRKAKRIGKLDAAAGGVEITEEMLKTRNGRPSLRGWQAVKESLDDRINSLYRSGSSKEGGALKKVQKQLLEELDRLSPEYRDARGIWAGAKAFENAMDDGKKFMQRGLNSAELKHMYSRMTAADKLAYKEGARQSIQNVLENAGETHDAAKFFRTPAMKKKLRTVFGPEAEDVLSVIEDSSAKQKTFATVTGNSKTALRTAAQAEESLRNELGEIGLEAFAYGPAASPSLARRVLKSLPSSRESTRNIAADMLLEADPAKQAQLLEWILSGKPLAGLSRLFSSLLIGVFMIG